MTDAFAHLFQNIALGPVTVPNRVFYPAHTTLFSDASRAAAYYAARARGGYGLLFCSANGDLGRSARADSRVEGYRQIVDAVYAHGAKVFLQIIPGFHFSPGRDPDPRTAAVEPSVLAPSVKGCMPRSAEARDIQSIVEGVSAEACLGIQGGLDGIEIHNTHHHDLHRWLFHAFNQRSDEFGGTLENRMRLLMQMLEGVREAIGRDIALGVRINHAYDTGAFLESREDALGVAEALYRSGLVDYLNNSGFPYFGGSGSPRGPLIDGAAEIKSRIGGKLPVLSTGDRIIDPRVAERVLRDGKVDMVGMLRAGIADPQIINKARAGFFEDIRACVGAGQGCLGHFDQGWPMMRTQNAAVGYEQKWDLEKAGGKVARVRKVLVVGGGPAGLEAALIAAKRGHDVMLFERQGVLGGQVNLIARSPRRNGFRNVVEWRQHQLKNLKVSIRLNVEVAPELVKEVAPDVVVLATGSIPRRVRYPGSDLPHVFTASDVMEGRLAGKRHVVVVDSSNYYQGTDPVEYLAARGTKVTIVTALPLFAAGASMNDAPVLLESLKDKDVTFHLNSEISGITATTVDCLESVNVPWGTWYYGGQKRAFSIERVDAVVLAIGADPDSTLWTALPSDRYEMYRIGDCLAPRGIEHAVYEGHKVAWSIGDISSEEV